MAEAGAALLQVISGFKHLSWPWSLHLHRKRWFLMSSLGRWFPPGSLFQLAFAVSPSVCWYSWRDWCWPQSTLTVTTLYLRYEEKMFLMLNIQICLAYFWTWMDFNLCCISTAHPRGQLIPLPGHLRGLHFRPPEGTTGAGGECRHLHRRQLWADQCACATLRRQRPGWHCARLSEGRFSHPFYLFFWVIHLLVFPLIYSSVFNLSVLGPHCLFRHCLGQMLHHRAEHNLGDAASKLVGAAYQCQGEALPIFPVRDAVWKWEVHAFQQKKKKGRMARPFCPLYSSCSVINGCVFATEGDVPSSDVHHPGGDDGDGAGEEHEAVGPIHPQTVLWQRNLSP